VIRKPSLGVRGTFVPSEPRLEAEPSPRSALHWLRQGTFAFRSLTEAQELAFALGKLCPEAELVPIGLVELMVNAVEHGNLELSYEEKRDLCRSGNWRAEVERRLSLDTYRARVATVTVYRQQGGWMFRICDEGPGFEWARFMNLEVGRARDPNGRGIALARSMGFKSLYYEEPGNVVVAEVASESES
jgi:Histidine kinase-like ATPase domain